jgi:hypothetical protein
MTAAAWKAALRGAGILPAIPPCGEKKPCLDAANEHTALPFHRDFC